MNNKYSNSFDVGERVFFLNEENKIEIGVVSSKEQRFDGSVLYSVTFFNGDISCIERLNGDGLNCTVDGLLCDIKNKYYESLIDIDEDDIISYIEKSLK